MHTRALSCQAHPGKLEDVIKLYHDSIVPAAKQQRGFKGATLLTDPTTGKILSLTFWESEADMLASETSGYLREQLAKVGPLLAVQPVREAYQLEPSGPPPIYD
jgi:heme-degrading monooxygenase HmoA